ncbi:MAG: Cell division protein ftsA [candidate division WS6 bacterium GW2011_GWF2_39_15]|uniref:Cell division protein FtsA n=1 Tax=candidate division WS6 bacterium GW2011_GWF2_39_15 TaxID=1619100 RepID=A0A0G0QWL5_9BACT|nr:MAG: Cell division protein ftsA [candidate division WS6 bacterium GW2011_GWF2_39_15]
MARKIITAIDVGSNKITTVITALDDAQQLPAVIGVCSQPSRGIKKGVVVNIEEATNAISESVSAAERMAGITVSDVFVSINGEQVTSLNNKGVVAVSDSEITVEDTYRAIENARTLSLPDTLNPIHIIPREFVVDNQGGIKYPIGMTGSRLEVETHIITAPNSYWRNIKKCVEQLALHVYDVVFVSWASSLAVLTDTEKELGVSLIDIGAGTSSISIFEEGAIAYSGCIPLGGGNITSDLAIGLQVSLEEAEKIKINMSKLLSNNITKGPNGEDRTPALLRKVEVKEEKKKDEIKKDDLIDVSVLGIKSQKEISKSFLRQIVHARLEEMFELIKDTVKKSGYNVAMPAGVVLTGGSALVEDATKVGQSVFGVPCRIGYPSGLSGMVEEISDPSYSAVQGLIKHALDDDVDAGSSSSEGGFSFGNIFKKVVSWFKSLLP